MYRNVWTSVYACMCHRFHVQLLEYYWIMPFPILCLRRRGNLLSYFIEPVMRRCFCFSSFRSLFLSYFLRIDIIIYLFRIDSVDCFLEQSVVFRHVFRGYVWQKENRQFGNRKGIALCSLLTNVCLENFSFGKMLRASYEQQKHFPRFS